jgi:hypothetical protein
VVPLLSLFRLVPVNCPSEISRVDVGGKPWGQGLASSAISEQDYSPVLKSVKLVRTNEVHLSGKCRLVALASEVVCVGRNFGAKDGGVVIPTDLGWQLTRAHSEPGRSTQR